MEEVRGATFKPENTTPVVRNAVIKLAWPYLGEAVTATCNMSFNWSVYPAIFKSANLCVVLKPNPRSYRLIALLSLLGKGLERVTVTRLAYGSVERAGGNNTSQLCLRYAQVLSHRSDP
jgi:hypothetical protein